MVATLTAAFYYNKDVKGTIQGMIDAGTKYFSPSNQNLGGDPAPNVYKYLTLQYDDDNVRTTRSAGEGQEIYIHPKQTIKFPTRLISAFYYNRDVTGTIQKMIDAGTQYFVPSNDALGGDPAQNIYKYLVLQFEIDGIRTTRSAGEGQQIWIGK